MSCIFISFSSCCSLSVVFPVGIYYHKGLLLGNEGQYYSHFWAHLKQLVPLQLAAIASHHGQDHLWPEQVHLGGALNSSPTSGSTKSPVWSLWCNSAWFMLTVLSRVNYQGISVPITLCYSICPLSPQYFCTPPRFHKLIFLCCSEGHRVISGFFYYCQVLTLYK